MELIILVPEVEHKLDANRCAHRAKVFLNELQIVFMFTLKKKYPNLLTVRQPAKQFELQTTTNSSKCG